MFRKIVAATIAAITLISVPVHATNRYGYIEDVDRAGDFTVLVADDGSGVWFWDGTTYGTKFGRKTFPVGAKVVIVLNHNEIVDFEIYER